jgi:hypothetical protein
MVDLMSRTLMHRSRSRAIKRLNKLDGTELFLRLSDLRWSMRLSILSALTPANHRAGDDRENGPTGEGYYHLAYDGAVVKAPQCWDQGLEHKCTDNAAYCSVTRISEA